MAKTRLVLPPENGELALLGTRADRVMRNQLQTRWLAQCCANWIAGQVELRRADGPIPQSAVVLRNGQSQPQQAILGSLAFSTDVLRIYP